ncbi:hypothetical protein [Algoriphagus boritolerans]|uniref:hypothetical protein n=1 Tax=Algoriphagus boritolerans TaxID=308111 RepID=UPI000B1975D9
MQLKQIIYLLPILFLVVACGKKNETCELDPKILDQDLDVTVTRLEDAFFWCPINPGLPLFIG